MEGSVAAVVGVVVVAVVVVVRVAVPCYESYAGSSQTMADTLCCSDDVSHVVAEADAVAVVVVVVVAVVVVEIGT